MEKVKKENPDKRPKYDYTLKSRDIYKVNRYIRSRGKYVTIDFNNGIFLYTGKVAVKISGLKQFKGSKKIIKNSLCIRVPIKLKMEILKLVSERLMIR